MSIDAIRWTEIWLDHFALALASPTDQVIKQFSSYWFDRSSILTRPRSILLLVFRLPATFRVFPEFWSSLLDRLNVLASVASIMVSASFVRIYLHEFTHPFRSPCFSLLRLRDCSPSHVRKIAILNYSAAYLLFCVLHSDTPMSLLD